MDECKEYGDAICGTWRCQNSLGSYRCIMGCQPGFHWTPLGDCIGEYGLSVPVPFLAGTTWLWNIFARVVEEKEEEEEACGQWRGR